MSEEVGCGVFDVNLKGGDSVSSVKIIEASAMGDTELKKELEQASAALLKVARVVHPGWNGKVKLKNNLKRRRRC